MWSASPDYGRGVQAVQAERVFDGDRFLDRPTVLVDGSTIVAVGVAVPESVPVVELTGATLLPGLVDAHQHLCFNGDGTLEEQVENVSDDELRVRSRHAAERALAAGVTTIRDVGDRAYVTLELRGDPQLPSILASGPPITRRDGHCWYLGGECDQDEAALRAAVRERAEHGCDLVKVMSTGGALTPTFPMWETQFSLEEMRVLVDEAHARGLPIAAHCHATQGIVNAMEAGVDTIEHCTFFTATGKSEPDDRVIEQLASSDVVVCADAGRLPGTPMPPIIAANLGSVRGAHKRLHDMGGTIIFGSDAGISPAKPHDVLPLGVADVALFGIPPLAILRGTTSIAATACGVGDRKGRLAPGYDADLVAVNGDPSVDLSALMSTVAVWKEGERIR